MTRFREFLQSDLDEFISHKKEPIRRLHGMTAKKYLNICRICYCAVYKDISTKDRDVETLYLEGRSISRKEAFFKNMDLHSESEFESWTKSGFGYFDHSYEILFGRVELRCLLDKDGYYFFVNDHNGGLNVEGSCLVIIMYNELKRRGIPVEIGKMNIEKIKRLGVKCHE